VRNSVPNNVRENTHETVTPSAQVCWWLQLSQFCSRPPAMPMSSIYENSRPIRTWEPVQRLGRLNDTLDTYTLKPYRQGYEPVLACRKPCDASVNVSATSVSHATCEQYPQGNSKCGCRYGALSVEHYCGCGLVFEWRPESGLHATMKLPHTVPGRFQRALMYVPLRGPSTVGMESPDSRALSQTNIISDRVIIATRIPHWVPIWGYRSLRSFLAAERNDSG